MNKAEFPHEKIEAVKKLKDDLKMLWNIHFRRDYDSYVDPVVFDELNELGGVQFEAKVLAKMMQALVPVGKEEKYVLDIGAGTGVVSLALSEAGYNVTATDLSQKALDHLGEKDATHTITRVQGDMNTHLNLPDASFDGITSLGANRFITDVPDFLSQVNRLLKPGGYFVWPITSGDSFTWKLNNGIGQQTTARGLARAVRAQEFSEVSIIKTSKEEKQRVRRDGGSHIFSHCIVARK